MLEVFAKENVCKCLFYIKRKKSKCHVWFCSLGCGVSLFLRTNHEQVLLEVEGPKFLIPLALHFTAQGVPVIGHVGSTVQHTYLSLAI